MRLRVRCAAGPAAARASDILAALRTALQSGVTKLKKDLAITRDGVLLLSDDSQVRRLQLGRPIAA